jgi:leucyl aminopeptidase (aminopeptidase T)
MTRCLSADLLKIAERTEAVAEILDRAKQVRITSPAGTDISFSIEGVNAIASKGLIHNPGEYGNLPSGEAYLMPVEGSAEGVFFVDGSMAGIGSLIDSEPICIRVVKGMAVEISGGMLASQLTDRLDQAGSLSRNIAEFGVGTNDAAIITGSILEDEKVSGTIHLALGNNVSMGGSVDVPLHLDGLIMKPTVELDGELLMKDGDLVSI